MDIAFPFKMLLRIYSLFILMFDLSWVVLNSVCAIVQSAYQLVKPPKLKSVKHETVMVVGAGRGVGRELALQLARLGATVICVDINSTNNMKTFNDIKHSNGKATVFMCDVTNRNNVISLASHVRSEVGLVTMIFYCCGIPSPRSLLNSPPQDLREPLDLTLTSFMVLLDQFLPDMKRENHGHVVALTSVAGLSYVKQQLPLSVAQFAVQGLAESLMEELRISKRSNVKVTLIHVYPFIVTHNDETQDLRLRIPSYFGTITPQAAASSILDSVRRNYAEASVPKHLLYLGHLLRILPRKATVLIRELLDTGVDFA